MQDTINLRNICQGALEEIFQEALGRVLENIRDVNTSEKAVRKMNIKFQFGPLPDRSGAAVSFEIETKMAGVKPVGGTIHIVRQGGKVAAFPFDPRQEQLFEPQKGQTQ